MCVCVCREGRLAIEAPPLPASSSVYMPAGQSTTSSRGQ